MQWFRWYHDTVSDPKLKLIADLTGTKTSDVIATWAAFLEYASKQKKRGSLAGLDLDVIAVSVGLSTDVIEIIHNAMIAKEMITRNAQVKNWRKRQPKSDVDTTRKERQRRYRERHKKRVTDPSLTPLDQIRSETDQILSSSSPPPVGEVPDEEEEFKKFSQGFRNAVNQAIAESVRHKNQALRDKSWMSQFIPAEFSRLKRENPKISGSQLLEAWKSTLAAASQFGARNRKWYETTFKQKLEVQK
jgi:hypothetical protein